MAVTDPDPLTNIVTASGTDLDGDPVVGSDTHSLDVDFAAALIVTKVGPATGQVSDNITYTFSVTHDLTSDGSDISAVAVTDDIAGTATYVLRRRRRLAPRGG